jgi:hypothetical protein
MYLHVTYLNYRLPEEVVRFPSQLLSEFWLEVVVFVPYSYLDPVWGVMTLTENGKRKIVTESKVELSRIENYLSVVLPQL